MPEREKINIDFGFTPTQVQQQVGGTPYSPPPALKSSETVMYENLAKLSGTLLNAYVGYSKRKAIEEDAWNNLSAEDKTRYNSAAQAAANAIAAGNDAEAEKITARYSAELVAAGKIPATHHQYFEERKVGYMAVNDLSTKLENHFTPEVRTQLANSDVNVEEYINKLIYGTQKDSDGNIIDIGLNQDTRDNLDHPLVQGLITSRESSIVPQIQAAQDRQAIEAFTNSAVGATATALFSVIDDGVNLTPEDIENGFSSTIDSFSTSAFKDIFNESGVNKLFPAVETVFNRLLTPGEEQNLDKAQILLKFTGGTGHRGTPVFGNRTFFDLNPEKVNEMEINYIKAKEKYDEDALRKKAEMRKRMNTELSDIEQGRLFDISSSGETPVDIYQSNFVDTQVKEFEDFLTENHEDLIARLKASQPGKVAYKAYLNGYRAKLRAMQNTVKTTDPSFEFGWARLIRDNQSDAILEQYLDDALFEDKTVSASEYITKKAWLRERGATNTLINNYDNRFKGNNSNFSAQVKGAIGAHSKLTLNIIQQAYAQADLTPAQAGRQGYVIAMLTTNIDYARSEKKRVLVKQFPNQPELARKELREWEDEILQQLQNGKIGEISGEGYYDSPTKLGDLADAYENITTLGK